MRVADEPRTLTIRALTDAWINNSIRPNPEYQRGSSWRRRQQQLLVDSVLRGYSLPRFYFQQKISTDPLGHKQVSLDVIDGQQRLIALSQFREDQWPIFSVEDGKVPLPPSIRRQTVPWSGKVFSALAEALQQEFLDVELSVVLIDEVTGDEVRDLFIRLQSGTPLTSQQVRDAWPGNIGPLIERLAGKGTRQGLHQKLFMAVDRRGSGGRSEDEYEDPALDARQTCAQLLLLLLSKERGRSYPSVRSSLLNDLYHENTEFDTRSRLALQFEHLLNATEQVILLRPPGEGRKAVRKSRLFSLFLFLRLLSFSPINLRRATKPIATLFWSDAAEDTEPVGRVGSADTLEKHFLWFLDERMAGLKLHELDRQRFFSPDEKRELWIRSGGKCGTCAESIPENTAEYDHIKPWILGGRTVLDNGRPVHPHCHARGLAAVDGREAPVHFDVGDSRS
jgi:hypothetical protein